MLHAMLWNEIHALQSVPPPSQLELLLPAAMLQQGARAPSHGDQTNEMSTPTERRRGERRGSGDDANTRYSSMPYAAHVRASF